MPEVLRQMPQVLRQMPQVLRQMPQVLCHMPQVLRQMPEVLHQMPEVLHLMPHVATLLQVLTWKLQVPILMHQILHQMSHKVLMVMPHKFLLMVHSALLVSMPQMVFVHPLVYLKRANCIVHEQWGEVPCNTGIQIPSSEISKPPKEELQLHRMCQILRFNTLLCWTEGAVPQDMRLRGTNAVTQLPVVYKNKGDRSDCC